MKLVIIFDSRFRTEVPTTHNRLICHVFSGDYQCVTAITVQQIRPSQVVQLLRQYELPMLILIAVQSSRAIRHQIWQYLTVWSRLQPILNGNDLRKLGYQLGPQYKLMLDDILATTLDGVMSDRIRDQEFLAKHYPLFNK